MSKYIHARVYRGKDDDLINWMESLPEGRRNELIREALRAGIGLVSPVSSEKEDIAHVIKQALYEALSELQMEAGQQPGVIDPNDVKDAFGERLDRLLNRFG